MILEELVLRGNKESFITYVKNIIFYKKEYAKQETPSYFIKYINKNFKNIVNYDDSYTLIDFGCGDGSTLQKLKICQKKVGIEIDPLIYKSAINKNKHTDILFINDNILNYSFDFNSIIFMYEPLWLSKNYLSIYNELFRTIANSNQCIYIIYITGLLQKIPEDLFYKFNFKLIHKHLFGSILLKRNLYIYSTFT